MRRYVQTPISLQCGHGHETVENGTIERKDNLTPHSFNAATAMRPWRTRQGVACLGNRT